MKPKTTHVFKVCTSSNEEMRRDAYCHEKNNRLKAMFKISNLTVFYLFTDLDMQRRNSTTSLKSCPEIGHV